MTRKKLREEQTMIMREHAAADVQVKSKIKTEVRNLAQEVKTGLTNINKSLSQIENDTQTLQKLINENNYLKERLDTFLYDLNRVFSEIQHVHRNPMDASYVITFRVPTFPKNMEDVPFLLEQKNMAGWEIAKKLIDIIKESNE